MARAAVQAGADLMIKKAGDLAQTQVEKLQTLVTQRLGPLDQQSVTAAADVLTKQAAVDVLADQVKSLQGQIDAAREAAARAAVSGKGSPSTGSAVAGSVQGQLDALNKQLIPAQTALEQAKSKAGVINAQRQGLQDQVQKATDSYLATQVSASLAAPPSRPFSGRKLHLVTMVGLEIIVSLAVAAASIAWLERRQLSRALRRAAAALSRSAGWLGSGVGFAGTGARGAHAAMTRLLVLGLDGATFDLLLPWAEQGRLPNFARLLAGGTAAELRSVPEHEHRAGMDHVHDRQEPGQARHLLVRRGG